MTEPEPVTVEIVYPPSREAVEEMWQRLHLIEEVVSPRVRLLQAAAVEEATLHAVAMGEDEIEDEAYTTAGFWLDMLDNLVLGNVAHVKRIIETGRPIGLDGGDG